MCLGIPGRLECITCEDPIARAGKVSFGGIRKEVNLAFVPEAVVGDYVIVHVGFAISRIDETEAMQVFAYLREMDELQELGEGAPAEDAPPAPARPLGA